MSRRAERISQVDHVLAAHGDLMHPGSSPRRKANRSQPSTQCCIYLYVAGQRLFLPVFEPGTVVATDLTSACPNSRIWLKSFVLEGNVLLQMPHACYQRQISSRQPVRSRPRRYAHLMCACFCSTSCLLRTFLLGLAHFLWRLQVTFALTVPTSFRGLVHG